MEILGLVVDAVPSGLFLVDEDGVIRMANRAAGMLFGWDPDTLVGCSVEELLPEGRRDVHGAERSGYMRSPTTRAMGEGRLLEGRRSDGSTFIVEVGLSPLVWEGSARVLAVVRDITARVDAEALARREEAWQAVTEDRMRIARDLHDGAIQELFSLGLRLAGVAGEVDGPHGATLAEMIDRMDVVIHELREAVFRLHAESDPRRGIERIVNDSVRVLGHRPELALEGDPGRLDPSLQRDVDSVVREALANVLRHARASATRVAVRIEDQRVAVVVTDDGVGIDAAGHEQGTGLRSLTERAAARGGELRVEPAPGGGTILVWEIPLPG